MSFANIYSAIGSWPLKIASGDGYESINYRRPLASNLNLVR